MSVLPSPLKSPVRIFTPGSWALCAKPGFAILVTLKPPSPLENATITESQPCPPASAMSVLPSPLKSPVRTFTPGSWALWAKPELAMLVTLKLPSPLENAMGTESQPWPATSAMSLFGTLSQVAACMHTTGAAIRISATALVRGRRCQQESLPCGSSISASGCAIRPSPSFFQFFSNSRRRLRASIHIHSSLTRGISKNGAIHAAFSAHRNRI